jgi:hypothetical protein
MKKGYITILFTLVCVCGLALGARADEPEDTVIVKVPYDFMVAGRVLPGGTYRVSRVDSAGGLRQLEISSYETHTSVLLIPTVFDDVKTGQPQVSLQHVGDTYFLNAIRTPIGTYAIHVPQSAISVAQMKNQGTGTSSGTN